MKIESLLGAKTTWLGLGYIVKAILTRIYPTDPDLNAVVDAVFAGLALIFVRDAVLKTERAAEAAIDQNEAIMRKIDNHESKATVRAVQRGEAADPGQVIDTEGDPAGLVDRLRSADRKLLDQLRRGLQDLAGRTQSLESERIVLRERTLGLETAVTELKQGAAPALEQLATLDTAVRVLQRDLRAATLPPMATAAAFRHIALALKAARLDRMERSMSEQFNQLQDALAGNEAKFIELQNAIATEGAQVTAELEALRNQVAPSLQPAIERALAHSANLQQAITQVSSIIPDVVPNPEPNPIPEPGPEPGPAPEPAPARRRS